MKLLAKQLEVLIFSAFLSKNNALIAQMIRTVDEVIEELPVEDGGLTLVNLDGARELALHSPAENAMEIYAEIKSSVVNRFE